MTPQKALRRTALFVALANVAACDIVKLATSDPPGLTQTWTIPAESTTISVAKVLPNGVSIYSTPGSNPPDSSAFSIQITTVPISQPLLSGGQGCTSCAALNGTTSNKPAFVLNASNATGLPANVVGGAIIGGQVSINVTNNLSFDPLYVNTGGGSPPQGYMAITINSGSVVLGVDTVRGSVTSQFAPGSVLSRTINLSSGNVTGGISANVVFNSPAGDHPVPINTSSTVNASFAVPSLLVGNVTINVPNVSFTPTQSTDLPNDIDESLIEHVVSGMMEMTISNPLAISGNVNVNFTYGSQPADVLVRNVALPASTPSPQIRTVAFDSTAMRRIFCGPVNTSNPDDCSPPGTTLTVSGVLSSAAPVTVTPTQKVSISNRLIFTTHFGGGN